MASPTWEVQSPDLKCGGRLITLIGLAPDTHNIIGKSGGLNVYGEDSDDKERRRDVLANKFCPAFGETPLRIVKVRRYVVHVG
jgi:hypothetical protein